MMSVAQFDVKAASARQKSPEEAASGFAREISGSTFARVARGDDERGAKARDFFLEVIRNREKGIETQLEKVRQIFQDNRRVQISGRSDYAGDAATVLCRRETPRPSEAATTFDPSARCHILVTSEVRGERLTAD